MKKSILVLGVLASLVMLIGCAKEPDSFVVKENLFFVAREGLTGTGIVWPKDSDGNEIYYCYVLKEAKGKYKKYEGCRIGYINSKYGFRFLTKCLSRIEEMISEDNFTVTGYGNDKYIMLNSYPSTYKDSDVTIAIEDYYEQIKIAPNYPWINGEQDMSSLTNYQANPDITPAFVLGFPVVGNNVRLTWHAASNVDISKLYCRLVDESSDVNWWKELNKPNQNSGENNPYEDDSTFIMKENIKGGEAFDVDFTLSIDEKPVSQVNLCIWYNVGDAEGPAIITSIE